MLAVAAAFAVPLPARLHSPPSAVVAYRDGAPAYVFLSPDEKWRMPVDAVDQRYAAALVRLEDKRFRYHPGVDPIALARAFAKNLRRGRVVSGGSTITMQLVRVLEPRPRTLSSKLVEMLRAMQLELRLSKDEILDAYLTFTPFGRNIEGVEAAAWSYFGHGASALSATETATLLAVPQDPNRRFPHPANELRLRAGRDRVARQLTRWDALTTATGVPFQADAPVPLRLRAFPREAPHAAFWLRQRHPGAARILTTLDAGQQRLVERRVRSASVQAKNQGVKNHATVVVDNATGEVRALVGGFDFWQNEHGTQIAGFDVGRSPGSALKPFIYALALDRGLALPEHLVEDVPRNFSGYSPKNFDGRFAGLVRLELALAQSLNVPFVNLLERLGLERFLGFLAGARATHVDDTPGKLGLSAAIGGIEVTALELAGLYAMLANDGVFRPLTLVAAGGDAAAVGDGLRLLSPGAAFLTRRALMLRDRPDFPRRRDFARLPTNVFWKTGTSFGHKDAWAIGANGRFTASVWFGNVNYAPSFALVGSDIAAPLLFDLLEALESPEMRRADELAAAHRGFAPEDLAPVEVCAYSGFLPGPGCAHRQPALALRANVPTEICPFHLALDVDEETGLALGPACRERRRATTKRFMVWPTNVKRHLADAHRTLPEPPSFHPACQVTSEHARLAIASPKPNHVVLLIPGLPADRQEVPLEAETTSPSGYLNWFVNGEFLGRHAATARVWWPPRVGTHEIAVTDGLGLVASRKVTVRRHQ